MKNLFASIVNHKQLFLVSYRYVYGDVFWEREIYPPLSERPRETWDGAHYESGDERIDVESSSETKSIWYCSANFYTSSRLMRSLFFFSVVREQTGIIAALFKKKKWHFINTQTGYFTCLVTPKCTFCSSCSSFLFYCDAHYKCNVEGESDFFPKCSEKIVSYGNYFSTRVQHVTMSSKLILF